MVPGISSEIPAERRLAPEPDTSRRTRLLSVRLRTFGAAISAGCIMLIFEITKQVIRPGISIWASHAATILSSALVTAFVAFAVLRREQRIRDQLWSSENRYRMLFERSLAGVYRSTLDGRILHCNAALCRMLGYVSPNEAVGQQLDADLFNSPDQMSLEDSLRDGNGLASFEQCLLGKDGRTVWVVNSATRLAGEDGSGPVIEGTLIDITERKSREEDLRRFAAIVRCSDEAIISLTKSGTIETWNAGAERIYGYHPEEVLGAPFDILVPAGRASEIQEMLEKVRRGPEVMRSETVHLKKGGRLLEISLAVSPIKDGGGNILGASAIARDITDQKRAEEALRQSEVQYRLLFDGNPVPMWVFANKTLKFLAVNEAAIRHYGFSKEQFLEMTIADIRPEEDVPALLRATSSRICGLQEPNVWRHRKKDGTVIDVEIVSHDLDFHGIEAELVAVRDITERKQAEEALRQAEEKYRVFFEDAIVGIFQTTPDGRPLSINRALAQLHGYDSPEELLAEVTNLHEQLFVDPNKLREWGQLLESKGAVRGAEVELRRKDGTKKWALVSLRAVRDVHGQIVLHEGTVEDITDRKVAEERVRFLAYYDALTGLPNRTLLQDRLAKALAGARRRKEKLALLFLDLDRFKNINDSLGHSSGDLLLQDVAARLKERAREQDTVARVGGDKFLIVLTSIKDVPDAAVAAERILDSLAAPFVVNGQTLDVTCSLGISIFPEHGTDGEALIKNADAAMYSAKDGGRNTFRFFTQDLEARVAERLTLENSLRHAIDRNEFFLMYQPQMDIATGEITGLEALLRWRHAELGLVPPDKFIRIAENSGLIVPIGEWVLRTACSQARKWHDDGVLAGPVAVNVSAVQFRQENFRDLIRAVLHETGLSPQYLELELTESLLLSDADVMFSVFSELKSIGLKLAIDDFGTGYSSLSYLKRFPVSKLKIDRSFIRDVAVNSDDSAIATAIISMAKSLNLKVIAEGVEDEAQMAFLRAHDCDEMQGYYLSKPLAVDDVAGMVRLASSSREKISGRSQNPVPCPMETLL